MKEMQRERKKKPRSFFAGFMLILTVIDVVFWALSPRREYFIYMTPLDHLVWSLSLHFDLLAAMCHRYGRLRLKRCHRPL